MSKKDKTKEELLTEAQLRAVEIDDMALDEEIMEAPGDLAYWNASYTKALREYLIEKHEFSITHAKVRMKIRAEKADATPKLTNDDVNALIALDEEHQTAELKFIEAEAEKERLKKFAEAVAAKKDMVQSLGAKLRSELEGDPNIRKQHRGRREYRE
jgi:hypothetical protein